MTTKELSIIPLARTIIVSLALITSNGCSKVIQIEQPKLAAQCNAPFQMVTNDSASSLYLVNLTLPGEISHFNLQIETQGSLMNLVAINQLGLELFRAKFTGKEVEITKGRLPIRLPWNLFFKSLFFGLSQENLKIGQCENVKIIKSRNIVRILNIEERSALVRYSFNNGDRNHILISDSTNGMLLELIRLN